MAQIPGGAISRFFYGCKYPFRGLDYISKNILWRRCFPAILINILAFAGLMVLIFTCGTDFNNWVANLIPEHDGGFVAKLLVVARSTVKVVLLLVELLFSLVLINIFGSALASPFLDSLSEEVEKREHKLLLPQVSFGETVLLSVRNSLKNLFKMLFIFIILLPLNLIPAVGSVLYFLLSNYFGALFNCLQYLSYPLDRRLVSFDDGFKVVTTNKEICLGFGLVVNFLTYIPILQLTLLPMAAVGGTLLFNDLSENNSLPEAVKAKINKI